MEENNNSKNRTPIIIAIISLIGILVVPIINIVGKQAEINTIVQLTREQNSVATPSFVFNKYDDPLGLFSVEYPNNFVILSREITDSSIIIVIGPEEFSFDEIYLEDDDIALIVVATGKSLESIDDVDSAFNEMIVNEIFNYQNEDGKRLLISNERVDKGYYSHFQETYSDKSVAHYYLLLEFNDNNFGYIAFVVSEGGLTTYNYIIESIISSFDWYPDEINVQFK